jgi:hypothetical protein
MIDDPTDNANLLGFGVFVETMSNFLLSPSLISPLVIAINGEWGSGKTSLIRTIKKRIDTAGQQCVFFDAWRFEYSDPAAALIWEVTANLGSKSQELADRARSIGKLAFDIFVRKYAGMSLDEIKKHFSQHVTATDNLATGLQSLVKESIGDKRVVVFIDDLDRCSLENVLQVLESLKLFLNLRNFVFVVAVDIDKLKLAWSYKYGAVDHTANEGLHYLEKIFQIEVGIPQPTSKEIREYIQSLDPKMPTEFTELISLARVSNPRRIKRVLNLISLRSSVSGEAVGKTEAAVIWTVLEALAGYLPTKVNLTYLYQHYQENTPDGFYGLLYEISRMPLETFIQEFGRNEYYKMLLQNCSDAKRVYVFAELSAKLLTGLDKRAAAKSLEEVVNFANYRTG